MTAGRQATCSRRIKGRSPRQQVSLAQIKGFVSNGNNNKVNTVALKALLAELSSIELYKKRCQRYIGSIQKLWDSNKLLEAQKRSLAAKAHNRLKSTKRAKLTALKRAGQRNQLIQDLKIVTSSLKNQVTAQKLATKQWCIDYDRAKKSKKYWRKRARAAEEARRYMWAKHSTLKRTPQTKLYGAYSPQIRSLCRQLVMSGVAVTQVRKVIRKTQIIAAQIEAAAKNEEARVQRTERQNKREEYIAGIQLVLDLAAIQTMVGKELDDQLKVYKKTAVLSSGQAFPAISKLKVAEKRALVLGLAQRYVQDMPPHEATGDPSKL